MTRTLLVTGATGAVGREVCRLAGVAGSWAVTGCSTRGSEDGVVAWDMCHADPPPALRRPWDVVIHAAADTRWTLPPEQAWRANVASTERLASLADDATTVVHVSTAYATGLQGTVASTALADYRNTYEWSKAGAERVVASLGICSVVVRPPLIVGSRATGAVARFSGLYTAVKAVLSGLLPAFVAIPDAFFEIVAVDEVAGCLLEQARAPAAGQVLTLGRGPLAPTVTEVANATFGSLNRWRGERGAAPVPTPPLVPPERWERFYRPFIDGELPDRYRHALDLLGAFQPYMQMREALPVTHLTAPPLEVLDRSIRYWCDNHRRLALASPRPWRERRRPPVVEEVECSS